MPHLRRTILLLLSALLGFAACNLNPDKPEFPTADTKPPGIMFIRPGQVDSPAYGANQYDSLDSLLVEAILTDNKQLKNYKIEFFYRGDLYYLKSNADSMVFTELGTISGREFHLNRLFTVEYDPLAGPYELKLTVWDSAGMTAVARTFVNVRNLQDTQLPTVTISSPSPNDTFSIGEFIPVSFSATDNISLYDATLRVRNTFSKEVIDSGTYRISPFSGVGNHSFYVYPTTPGNYSVEVYVTDINRNIKLEKVPIYITTY